MKSFVGISFFVLLGFFHQVVFSVDIGSDTAVNRFNAQQTLNEGDRVAGFAALQGGLVLNDSTVTATFDSFFPISGEVDLADGTLVLGRDFVFRDVAVFEQLGDIVGDGHSMEFSASITQIPSIGGTSNTFSDLKVFLHSNLVMTDCQIIFSGESILNGRGNILSLDPTCTIVIESGASLLISDIILDGISGTMIHCTDSSSTISFHNVEWIQDGDYSFTVGKFDVLKDFIIVGDGHTFGYQTDQISTVSTNGRIVIDNGVIFSYDPPTANRELLSMHSGTSEFFLNGATLRATSTGMRFSNGIFSVDRSSALYSNGTVDAEGISFATGVDMQFFPAAVIDYLNGFIVFE